MRFKEYLMIITLIICLCTNKVNALEVTQRTDGESTTINLPDCFEGSGQNCGGLTSDFIIRVTMVDQNKQVVPGTETIEIQAQNPFNNEPYEECIGCSYTQDYSVNGNVNWDNDQYEKYVSTTVGRKGNDQAEYWTDNVNRYRIYLGFGYNMDEPHWETFDNYSELRNGFINYATNLRDKQITGEGIDGRISFVEFVFKKTGFTDNVLGVHNTAKYNGEAMQRMKELKNEGNHYYILIEPVYTFMMYDASRGKNHEFRGTAKQLAYFAYNTANDHGLSYWPIGHYEYMYNLYCNFLDESGALGLSHDNSWRCESPDRFKNITYVTEEIQTRQNELANECYKGKNGIFRAIYTRKNGWFDTQSCLNYAYKNYIWDFQIEYRTSAVYDINFMKNIYNELKDDNTAYGVNIISIDELMEKNRPKETNCKYEINSCTGNDFEYSAKLTTEGESTFDCIYPSDNNKMSVEELNRIATRYEYLDLWCYDDVNYSFKNLQQINNLNNTPFKPAQLVLVPSGKLTVNRTCFTKQNLNQETTDLSAIFERDDGKYQSEFILKMNDKNYIYEKGNKYQDVSQTKDGSMKTSNFDYTISQITSNRGETYTTVTSSFTYDYNIQTGLKYNDKLSIGIKNYDIGYGNLYNSILYKKDYNIPGNIIVIENTQTGTYFNEITTKKGEFNAGLNEGYGLSNNLYKNIIEENKTTTDEVDRTITKSTKELIHEEGNDTHKNIYTIEEVKSKTCGFKTEIINFDLFDGINDGVQFRVISLSNPFPARDGTSRLAGKNWINKEENNVYTYIQNNRNVKEEEVYQQEPLYTVTLDTASMIRIREYNKTHTYSNSDIICEEGTGRMCISGFLRDTTHNYIANFGGTCAGVNSENTSNFYTCADKTAKSGG